MSARKKGIIGAIIGTVVGVGSFIFVLAQMADDLDPLMLLMIPAGAVGGALYGFGFAFGWPYAKGWLAKSFGVAATGSILTILFSKDRRQGFILAFALFFSILILGLTLSYIPGIFKGIKEIRAEKAMS